MGLRLEVDHKFSAEIVPFKQAFIERNFAPKIIYRDVTELHNGSGTTVYGAEIDLPEQGKVDILVAGFACVDFSYLNNKRKQLNVATSEQGMDEMITDFLEGKTEHGESSTTLQAVIHYAKNYRPPIVILENVNSAPWDEIMACFTDMGFSVGLATVDTKEYYLPQTRQRKYLICILHARNGVRGGLEATVADSVAVAWIDTMAALKRPASSPFEDFMLQDGHPELAKALSAMIQDFDETLESKKETDWNICFGRHLRYRDENGLGTHVPYTNWLARKLLIPEYALVKWISMQTDRVKDCLDILILEAAAAEAKNFDFEYKSRCPDLSQNIDRGLDGDKFGLVGCLTPNGMPFLSFRGSPMVGLEALVLQGLDPKRLLLTKESQSDLRDLAGNAMTLTVVGAALLAALMVAYRVFPEEPDTVEASTECQHINFQQIPMKLRQFEFGPIHTHLTRYFLELGEKTLRMCHCESEHTTGSHHLLRCTECGHTACRRCAGNPKHVYRELYIPTRLNPREFKDMIFEILPTRLKLYRFEELQELLYRFLVSSNAPKVTGAEQLESEEFRLKMVQFFTSWIVRYESQNLWLILSIRAGQATWQIFIKPASNLRANDPHRTLFSRPIATMKVTPDKTILSGAWELLKPSKGSVTVSIIGKGEKVPSWKAGLGLEKFKDERVWSEFELQFPSNTNHGLLQSLAGTYKLLPLCGTASRCLYKRKSDAGDPARADLYLFLDPGRNQASEEDEFVISDSKERLSIGEHRPVIARIGAILDSRREPTQNRWRPSSNERDEAQLIPNSEASSCKGSLEVWSDAAPHFLVPETPLTETLSEISNHQNCQDASTLIFSCQIPWYDGAPDGQSQTGRCIINQDNQVRMIADLDWLTERLPPHIYITADWQNMHCKDANHICPRCAPVKPEIEWAILYKQKDSDSNDPNKKDHSEGNDTAPQEDEEKDPVPRENRKSAGRYEQAFKTRPSPFTITMERLSENPKMQELEIAVSIRSLAHRAIASLPNLPYHARGVIDVSWKMTRSSQESIVREKLKPFELLNCDEEEPRDWFFENTPFRLRQDQARSFQWMISRDSKEVLPFSETAFEESISHHIGFKLEARAVRKRKSRGGIVADDVGFGKTVTILALIQNRKDEAAIDYVGIRTELVPLKATLIILPPTLVDQWNDEISKFLPRYKVLQITSLSDLERSTIGEFQDSDIVLVSVTILGQKYAKYTSRFAELAGRPGMNGLKTDREYSAWLADALPRLKNTTTKLQTARSDKDIEKIPDELVNDVKEFKRDCPRVLPDSFRQKGAKHTKAQLARLAKQMDKSTTEPTKEKAKQGTPRKQEGINGFESAKRLSDVKFPVLHMFRFHRKVVDEQSYLQPDNELSIKALDTISTWLLTGTPQLKDVYDVQRLANQLDIYIGPVDDDPVRTTPKNVELIKKNRTSVEQFEAYNTTHTTMWYSRQRDLAQDFLNLCMRKNHAQMSVAIGIVTSETVVPVQLSSAHMIAYQELQSQLVSGRATQSNAPKGVLAHDRSKRLENVHSDTIDESLLKLSFESPSSESISTQEFTDHQARKFLADSVRATQKADVLLINQWPKNTVAVL